MTGSEWVLVALWAELVVGLLVLLATVYAVTRLTRDVHRAQRERADRQAEARERLRRAASGHL